MALTIIDLKSQVTFSGSATPPAFSTNPAAGDLIVLCLEVNNRGAAVPTVSDNKGNTYTRLGSIVDNIPVLNGSGLMFYTVVVTGGASFTITINVGASVGTAYGAWLIRGAAASPYNGDVRSATGTGTSMGPGTLPAPPQTSIAIAFLSFGGSGYPSGGVPSGWNVVGSNGFTSGMNGQTAPSNWSAPFWADCLMIYKVTTTAETPVWTNSASVTWLSLIASFKDDGPPPVSGPYPTIILADNPVAYWRMNARSGTLELDRTANHNDGTLSGGVTLNTAGPLSDLDPAMTFDGVDDQIVAPASTSLNGVGNGSFTIEVWVKPAVTGNSSVISKSALSGTGADGWHLRLRTSNQAQLRGGDGTNVFAGSSAAGSVPVGVWTHVVAVLDRTQATIPQLYINGVASGTGNPAVAMGALAPANPVLIGVTPEAATNSFKGDLDEIAIYATVLTPTQIAAHYAARTAGYTEVIRASTPAAYWRLNDASGTTAIEVINAANATITPPVTYANPGPSGSTGITAMGFNVAGYAQVNSVPAIAALAQLSVECLVWLREPVAVAQFIEKAISAVSGTCFRMYFEPPYTIWRIYRTPGGEGNWQQVVGPKLRWNSWYHCVGTFDGTTLKYYVNGILIGSKTYNPIAVGDGVVTLGRMTPPNTYLHDGYLCEVAIYARALPADEVLTHSTAAGSLGIVDLAPPDGGGAGGGAATLYATVPIGVTWPPWS